MRTLRYIINTILVLIITTAVGQIITRLNAGKENSPVIAEEVPKSSSRHEEQQLLIEMSKHMELPEDDPSLRSTKEPSCSIVEGRLGYQYICFLPSGFDENKKWPLILYLHGAGLKGNNLKPLYGQGPFPYLQFRNDPFFIAVAPLCPANAGWNSVELNGFLKQFMKKKPVDRNRIYLTGISMGGHGAWSLASDFPRNFAAIAPLCGAGNPSKAKRRLKHTPVWIFHGAKDDIVPVRYGIEMERALQSVGGNVRLTIFPDIGHGGIAGIYNNPKLYDWFLSHKMKVNS